MDFSFFFLAGARSKPVDADFLEVLFLVVPVKQLVDEGRDPEKYLLKQEA